MQDSKEWNQTTYKKTHVKEKQAAQTQLEILCIFPKKESRSF